MKASVTSRSIFRAASRMIDGGVNPGAESKSDVWIDLSTVRDDMLGRR